MQQQQQQPQGGAGFDAQRFMGTWHVVYSTLAMWKRGDKLDPRLEYDQLKSIPGEGHQWRDRVHFQGKGLLSRSFTPKTIVGSDSCSLGSAAFTWRGSGLLSLIHCPCKVVDWDPAMQDFCVIVFGSTAFTAPGVDVCRRSPAEFSPQELSGVLERARADPQCRQLLEQHVLEPTRKSPLVNPP